MFGGSTRMALLLVAAAAATAALGPPNGTVGTLDFRYPDHIVEPLVPCPFDGVFPHPHDCTWYYRCYDRYGYGFHWRAYFQCEPGTVFADGLDQCVHQGPEYECEPTAAPAPCRPELKDCREHQICPLTTFGTAFISTVEVCYNSINICQGQPNQPLCPPDFLYDNSNKHCIEERSLCQEPTTRPPAPDIVCEDQLSACNEYQVCRAGEDPQLYRLCQVNKSCYHTSGASSSTSLCPEGELFNVFTNECIKQFTAEDACPDNTLVVPGDVPCVQETESCSVFESCETREKFLGCSSYFLCGNAVRSSVCRHGQVFVSKFGGCLQLSGLRQEGQPPGGLYSPCMFTGITAPPPVGIETTTPFATAPPPTAAPPPVTAAPPPVTAAPPPVTTSATPSPTSGVAPYDINDFFDNEFVCQYSSEVPHAEGHRNLSCSDRRICTKEGVYQVTLVGCDRYFECADDPTSFNHLGLETRACDPPQFYNYYFAMCANYDKYGGVPCSMFTTAGPTTPTTAPTPDPVTTTATPVTTNGELIVGVPITVTCKFPGEFPDMSEKARQLYCFTNSLCDGGNYLGMETICSEYFLCRRNKNTRVLEAVLESCPDADERYDPFTKNCIVPNPNKCGVRAAQPAIRPALIPGRPHHNPWIRPSNPAAGSSQQNPSEFYPQPSLGYQPQAPGIYHQNALPIFQQNPTVVQQQQQQQQQTRLQQLPSSAGFQQQIPVIFQQQKPTSTYQQKQSTFQEQSPAGFQQQSPAGFQHQPPTQFNQKYPSESHSQRMSYKPKPNPSVIHPQNPFGTHQQRPFGFRQTNQL